MAEITFGSIIVLVAGSSVLAAIVTQTISAIREYRQRNREAAFSALYVAIALEDYAGQCSSLISDSENYESSGGYAGAARGNIAPLPDYSQSIEWKPFGIKATTKVLSFRIDIDNTRARIDDYWEYDDEDSIVPLVREESAKLGVAALKLAIDLRRQWRIDPVEYDDEWSVKSHLETKLDWYARRRKDIAERYSKLGDVSLEVDPPAPVSETQEPS